MALIKCPECGKEISDKSNACIHCGFPLDNANNNPKLYSIVFKKLSKKANVFLIKATLEQMYGIPKNQIYNMMYEPGSIVLDGIEESKIQYIKSEFSSMGYIVDSIPSNSGYYNPQNENMKNSIEKQSEQICCPRCRSTQITTGQRGFSLLTGFIGNNKTVNRCAKCGYTWKP